MPALRPCNTDSFFLCAAADHDVVIRNVWVEPQLGPATLSLTPTTPSSPGVPAFSGEAGLPRRVEGQADSGPVSVGYLARVIENGRCRRVLLNASPTSAADRSTTCYTPPMAKEITQRELRNESGEIMRRLDEGESFVVTRNGVPVGELSPLRRHRFVRADAAVALFRHAPSVDLAKLRSDLDRAATQEATPRG